MSSVDEGEPPVTTDTPALDRWPTYTLDHAIETVGSDGEQCTIYPSRSTTTSGDAFVAIDEIR
ncbi:hypothetical protein DU504_06165 [Haloplanus salinus]|uniref:Uncharacterized protein n=1 Tax=Haloplanus salinus TaxID=1126245 RepID=A0A368N9J8_9EURY|nr:hypothetical protein [Haloplanus salinus]RCU46926.1 hypothetical protein DU504_06165 [Haloplanus salinus]